MRRHYDVNGVKNLLYACSLVKRLTIIDALPLPADPMIAIKKRAIRQREVDLFMDGFIAQKFGGFELKFTSILDSKHPYSFSLVFSIYFNIA